MFNIIFVIFFNGTDAMVFIFFLNFFHAYFFKHIVTIKKVKKYKPAPRAYNFLTRKVKKREKKLKKFN